MMMTAASKYTWRAAGGTSVGQASTSMEYTQAVPVPRAMSVSMLARWLRNDFHAPTKKWPPP